MRWFFFERSKTTRNSFPSSEVTVLREFEAVHSNFLKDIEIQSQYAVQMTQSDIDVAGLVNALFADKEISVEARLIDVRHRASILRAYLDSAISRDLLEPEKPPRYSPLYLWWKNKFANNGITSKGEGNEKAA